MKCDRCGKETNIWTTSMFNTETVCMHCKYDETQLPEYKEAQEAERKAVAKGNFNFEGIGFPKRGA